MEAINLKLWRGILLEIKRFWYKILRKFVNVKRISMVIFGEYIEPLLSLSNKQIK